MENSDAFGSSTAPLTWHDFLERMRQPSASDFVKSIKSFIVTFSNNVPDPERDSAAVQEFLARMEEAFRAHQLWAGCSEEELESAGEGLEKYVMTKLFNRAFASLPEDVKHDEQLHEKMALVQQFIKPENLDIKPDFQNETALLLAQKELQKINMYKAPRDKLICILNCCKVVNNLLLNASIVSNENPPGADDFLPVLIYVTIKANPPHLHSNLLYIQRYRRQSRLVAEAAYFFTNILSAGSFIWNIDAQSLSMEESEFKQNMEFARALLTGLSDNLESSTDRTDEVVGASKPEDLEGKKEKDFPRAMPAPKKAEDTKEAEEKTNSGSSKPSILELEKKGVSDLLQETDVGSTFLEYPFLYAQLGDLTIHDVEALLNSYKQIVLKYVSLSRGLEPKDQSSQMNSTQIDRALQEYEKTEKIEDKNDNENIEIPVQEFNEGSSVSVDTAVSKVGASDDDETVEHSSEQMQS